VYVYHFTCLRQVWHTASLHAMPPAANADPALAGVLRELRESQGRSQEALAHAAGIAVNSLRRIEYGQSNPTWTTVRALAAALEISLAELGRQVDARRAR
jgi:transcriptional regulator with XRE-family HTH domain